ncbi:MAG: hypothetical protein M9894_15230 [Planctomycetes bacterium]|nr:hypothetical protein [Planctomycetota bacterium]
MSTRLLLLRTFDKAILAACALWLTGAAAGLRDRAPDEATRVDLDRSLAAVGAHFAGAPSIAPAPAPAWAEALRARLLAPPEVPSLWPAWALHRRPAFVFDVVAPPQPPPFRHEAAQGVVATAERGRVVVRWTSGAAAYVLVDAAVERREGDGPWEVVASPAPAGEFVDTDVQPRARYRYRVVTMARPDAEDRQVQLASQAGTFQALDPALARRESPPSDEVETPPELYVVPLSVDLVPHRPAACTAYALVHRWDRAAGRFTSERVRLKVGQRLGHAVVEGVGEEGATLWVTLRRPDGALLREDSRRDRLPVELR